MIINFGVMPCLNSEGKNVMRVIKMVKTQNALVLVTVVNGNTSYRPEVNGNDNCL